MCWIRWRRFLCLGSYAVVVELPEILTNVDWTMTMFVR